MCRNNSNTGVQRNSNSFKNRKYLKHFTVSKRMSLGLFKKDVYKMCLQIIYLMYEDH